MNGSQDVNNLLIGSYSGYTSQEPSGGMMPMIAFPVREDQLLIKSNGSMSGSLYHTQQNLPQLNMSMMDEGKPQQTSHVDI